MSFRTTSACFRATTFALALLGASGVSRTAAAQAAPGVAFTARYADVPEAAAVDAPEQPSARPDRFFPGAGHVSIAAASGVPFVGFGEVQVGASDGFTIGVMGGVADTLKEAGVGGRMQAAIFRAPNVEMLLTVPVLYYPPSKRRDGDSWILANPAALLQGRTAHGSAIYGGVGGLAASCTDGLISHFGGTPDHDKEMGKGKDKIPDVNGAWNTFHVGGSIPTSATTTLFTDGSLIMSGLSVSETYSQRVGVPVVAELGFSARF